MNRGFDEGEATGVAEKIAVTMATIFRFLGEERERRKRDREREREGGEKREVFSSCSFVPCFFFACKFVNLFFFFFFQEREKGN